MFRVGHAARMALVLSLFANWNTIGAPEPRMPDGPARTIVTLTGGRMTGTVVDHSDAGLVLETPEGELFAFGWRELETGSAYVVRRSLLGNARGGVDRMTATDRMRLGRFMLDLGRPDLAAQEFDRARRLDPSREGEIKREGARPARRLKDDSSETSKAAGAVHAPASHPSQRKQADHGPAEPAPADSPAESAGLAGWDWPEEYEQAADPKIHDSPDDASMTTNGVRIIPPAVRARFDTVYRTFGALVQQDMGRDVVLLETDHFLIWTDWRPRDHDRLRAWCETVYTGLCREFGLNVDDPVFVAKLPVFCWQGRGRFRIFAERFDGFSGRQSIGYTRIVPAKGHVHLVLLLDGRTESDYDRAACTLAHETSHAFLHRLFGPRPLPSWVNEGLAEWMSDRIWGDRCPAAGKAGLLARQYVQQGRRISEMVLQPVDGSSMLGDEINRPKRRLEHFEVPTPGAIPLHQYPLAHSVVSYLLERKRSAWPGFIHLLKDGRSVPDALSASFDGLTVDDLERSWRRWVAEKQEGVLGTVSPESAQSGNALETPGR